MTQDAPPELEAVLDYLKRTRGFDFTAYKRASLVRRIQKRMQMVGVRDFTDDLLDVSRVETGKLALRQERVRLDHLANRCAATIEGTATARGRQLTVQADPVEVDGDPARP